MLLFALLVGPSGPAVALGDDAARVIERSAQGGAVEQLPRLVRDALETAGLGFGALEALAVLTGPGRFTAVRAAVAAVRALALALKREVFALSAFELGAHAVGGAASVLVPVGRDLLALQSFSAPDAACGEPALLPRGELPRLVERAHPFVVVDPDDELAAAVAGRALAIESSARRLWAAAHARAARGHRPVPGPRCGHFICARRMPDRRPVGRS